MSEQLNEVFDGAIDLSAVNLNPKLKVPQIWNIKAEGNENLVARMVSYTSEGDTIRQVKPGDKYVHIILMSLSSKGAPAELKGGLGSNPISAIRSIFDTVYEQVKKLRMDAVMFRFPTKKMKGQEKAVQRVLAKLIATRAGGQFKVLDALYQYTGKHSYVFIYRKNKNIESINGIPNINPELYTKVESEVGDVYVSKKTGEDVTKLEAIAKSIDEIEKSRSDKMVITKTKVSKRAAINALYSTAEPTGLSKFSAEHKKAYADYSATSPVHSSEDSKESQIALASNKILKDASKEMAEYLDYIFNGVNPSFEVDERKLKLIADIKFALEASDSLDKSNSVIEALKSGKSHVDILRLVAAALLDDSVKGTWARESKIKEVIKSLVAVYTKSIQPLFKISDNPNLSKPQEEAVKKYTRGGYNHINNFLLGKTDTTDEMIKMIGELDSTFENGTKLPKGTIVYRSQIMPTEMALNSIKHKVMYLPIFASTSLAPNIFGEMGHAQSNLDPEALSSDIDSNLEDTIKSATGSARDTIKLGLIIKGADKIKVIVPGDLANWSTETEVILPRGVMLKINKVYGASKGPMGSIGKYVLVECEVVATEQITEENSYSTGFSFGNYDRIMYEDSMEKLANLFK